MLKHFTGKSTYRKTNDYYNISSNVALPLCILFIKRRGLCRYSHKKCLYSSYQAHLKKKRIACVKTNENANKSETTPPTHRNSILLS